MIVSLVPDDAVDMIWGRISHFIKKATFDFKTLKELGLLSVICKPF